MGYNANPLQNEPCNANPNGTGVWTCGGLVGTHLGIGSATHTAINFSQIRAYSDEFNGYSGFTTTYFPVAGGVETDGPINFLNGPLIQGYSSKYADRGDGTSSMLYIEIRFDVSRFV